MADWERYCPRCETAIAKWNFVAPPDYYRCWECLLATPFKDLPRRNLLRTINVSGPFVPPGVHASDIYLLESGAPDGYMLEDGSGVLLLE